MALRGGGGVTIKQKMDSERGQGWSVDGRDQSWSVDGQGSKQNRKAAP